MMVGEIILVEFAAFGLRNPYLLIASSQSLHKSSRPQVSYKMRGSYLDHQDNQPTLSPILYV